MKYILVTGGVISGVGKGVIASSFGTILKSCGIHVTSIKIDPYINIDAGTFSPYEHGEFISVNVDWMYSVIMDWHESNSRAALWDGMPLDTRLSTVIVSCIVRSMAFIGANVFIGL